MCVKTKSHDAATVPRLVNKVVVPSGFDAPEQFESKRESLNTNQGREAMKRVTSEVVVDVTGSI